MPAKPGILPENPAISILYRYFTGIFRDFQGFFKDLWEGFRAIALL